MKPVNRKPGGWLQSARGGRRPWPAIVLLMLLAGVWAITSMTAGVASAENQPTYKEKGTNTMEQSATALGPDLPRLDVTQPSRVETFTFGLGWFWGVEARFGSLKGVVRTRVGYSGGTKKQPTYRSLGDHTETVAVDFDPGQISYGELLEVFWASHNPGSAPWSRQYMNVIFTHNDEQKRLAEDSLARVAAKTGSPVKTAILPATEFTLAEDYHQKYYLRQAPVLFQEMSRYYPNLIDLVNSKTASRLNGYVAGYGSLALLEEELPGMGLAADTGAQLLAAVAARSGQARGCPLPR